MSLQGLPIDTLAMATTTRRNWRQHFAVMADRITVGAGSLPALLGSVTLVVVWALTGPIFNFSDTWQLFINTTTTVITFWMVFIIQNTANRQGKATQLKLDEIIRSLAEARNDFVMLDHATEDVLDEREREFAAMANGETDLPPSRTRTGASRAGEPIGVIQSCRSPTERDRIDEREVDGTVHVPRSLA